MNMSNNDKVLVECVWGSTSFRQGYTQIGFFESDAPNWPRIYVTVPKNWAETQSEDSLNKFVVRATKEFIDRFNAGDIKASQEKLELFQEFQKELKPKIMITIHKDAVTRFNQEGATLVSLCKTGEYFQKTQQRKKSGFPEIYSHGELTDKNTSIIEVAMSNGFGEQIARYFENSQIGLEAENYKRFVELCESIQRSITPKSIISLEIIEDFTFKWIEKKFKNLIDTELLGFLIPKMEEEITECEIWIPIAELRTARIIPLGKINIKPITEEWLNHWQAISLSDTPQEFRERKAEFYKDKITKPFQGWSAGVLTIHADRKAAMEIAIHETERALAVLRFFSIAALTPKINSYVAIMGSQNIETITSLTFTNGKFAYFNDSVVDKASFQPLLLDDVALFRMKSSGIGILNDILRKEKLTSFEEKLLGSIILYSNATREKNLASKILYILSSLENIFLQNDTEPIMQNLSERIATLLGKNLQEKKDIIKTIRTIYSSRSKFLHHAQSMNQYEELERFVNYAFLALAFTIKRSNEFSTTQGFVSFLDDKKLS